MKKLISILMIIFMLITSVPLTGAVTCAQSEDEEYTLTVENTYADSSVSQNSTAGGISFFGVTEFDGCYGNQLSGTSKELYDSLVKNYATDKKTGSYIYAFTTPFTFNAEISDGKIVMNDELEEIYYELSCSMQAAIDAFLYDHPEVFWLRIVSSSYSISASYGSSGYIGKISSISITPVEIYSGASSKISQYDSAVGSAISKIAVNNSRSDTLKAVHDYICNNAYYRLISDYFVHSSEAFFIGDGGVVCEGYAKSFKVICDKLGIPCALVSGYAGEPHMWNCVQMEDGKWYLVDATWDDQESRIYYTYFLANANTIGFDGISISNERTENNDFSGSGVFGFTYPVLSATAYTEHSHEWESDYTVDLEPTCTESGSKSIHCKTCGETKSVTEIPATNHIGRTEYPQQDATCTEGGYTAGVYCTDCDEWIEGHELISTASHTYESVTTPATLTSEGKTEYICSCGDVEKTEAIAKVGAVTLSATKYIYDGKNKTPRVTVTDADGNRLVKNVDYKTSVASKRSGIGRYTVKVTFIGKYSGSKNVYFTILPGKPASVKSASQTTSSVKLSWSAVPGAAGYTVYRYSPTKKAYVKAGTTEGTSYTVSKLYTGTKYTFRVVSYGKTSAGKVYDSDVYALLKTATKTKTPELTKVTASSTKGKAYVYHSNVSGETGYTIYYSTSKDSGFKKYANFKADTTRCDITGLTSGKTYYFKVRTYIKTDSGYVYSSWSSVKSVKVK